MNKSKNVIEFYILCNKLKSVIRTGWKDWGVKRERVESIAEHIFSVQMLAISMWSEFNYELDIRKVVTMLAIHELEEIIIGDLTCFQIDKQTKAEKGHKAIKEVLAFLSRGAELEELILEFDEGKTEEARFAFQCDKLECDLQCRVYDEENCVDLHKQEGNSTSKDANVKRLLDEGKSWSEMWLLMGQQRYAYDKNFMAVSNYALKNKITKS